MSKLYDIWTDGAYNNTHHVGGAGWLIRHEGEEDRAAWKGITHVDKHAKPHGSDLAEIFAVGGALRQIPPNSVVRLRLDCQNVLDWFQQGEITTRSKREVFMLRNVFRSAMDAVRAMESVTFIKVGGNANAELSIAHHQAREGSMHARERIGKPPKRSKRLG